MDYEDKLIVALAMVVSFIGAFVLGLTVGLKGW